MYKDGVTIQEISKQFNSGNATKKGAWATIRDLLVRENVYKTTKRVCPRLSNSDFAEIYSRKDSGEQIKDMLHEYGITQGSWARQRKTYNKIDKK